MDTHNRILINMAINNVEEKIRDKEDVGVSKFNQMVIQRYKIYCDIHKDVE